MSVNNNMDDNIIVDKINLLILDEVDENNILFSSKEISKTLDFIEENDIVIPCMFKNKKIGFVSRFYLQYSCLYADIIIIEDNMCDHLNGFTLELKYNINYRYNDFANLAEHIEFKKIIVN